MLGTLAGVWRLGGGMIIVPVLVYSSLQGFAPEVLTHNGLVVLRLATFAFTSINAIPCPPP